MFSSVEWNIARYKSHLSIVSNQGLIEFYQRKLMELSISSARSSDMKQMLEDLSKG